MADEPLLETKDLTKRFGVRRAVDGVDLAVGSGEMLLITGPNGAGKTTLIRMIGTLIRPTSGTIRMAGQDKEDARARRRVLAYLSHDTCLYEHLTAGENLRFFGGLNGVRDTAVRTAEVLESVGLSGVEDRRVRAFSRGMKQRLAVARVLLGEPKLLLLDEPYTGLDPAGRRTLTGLLGDLKARGTSLLVITHLIEDCLPAADGICVMKTGRMISRISAAGRGAGEVLEEYEAAVAHG